MSPNFDHYKTARGYEAGHDKAWHEKWGEGIRDRYPNLTDKDIEAIEARNAICLGCHKKKCSECEV